MNCTAGPKLLLPKPLEKLSLPHVESKSGYNPEGVPHNVLIVTFTKCIRAQCFDHNLNNK